MPCNSALPDFRGRFLANRRLRLLDLLGAGAYGKVYRAHDTASPEDSPIYYAVKCMKKYEPGSRGESIQQREFSLHARVASHPNVITFHDVLHEGLFVYVVMDLCSGGDLHSAIVEKRVFYQKDELVRKAFLQILDAVEACHDNGVFHRDLKPDNILCSDDGTRIFLADFGLATTVTDCKDFGCGSLFYKSHESMGALKLPTYSTKQSDVWSLGIVLLNLVTGRSPWRQAQESDPSFVKAFADPDYFRNTLPISLGVINIARRIFDLDPSTRITIPELRARIIELDTFFMSDEEVLVAPEQVRIVAGYFSSRPSQGSSTIDSLGTGVRMYGGGRPVESSGAAIVASPFVFQVDVNAPRHRAPGSAPFPPPRRRKVLEKVVEKLKELSSVSSSLLSA